MFKRVGVSNVAEQSSMELIGVLFGEAMWCEFFEFMCGVGVTM
jgi:hypothetical protein